MATKFCLSMQILAVNRSNIHNISITLIDGDKMLYKTVPQIDLKVPYITQAVSENALTVPQIATTVPQIAPAVPQIAVTVPQIAPPCSLSNCHNGHSNCSHIVPQIALTVPTIALIVL